MVLKLFISKSINELDSFQKFCQEKGIEVIAHSFLTFESVPFQVEQNFQAVFFGSPRAVNFYLAQEKIPPSVFIGCIGEVTAQSLIEKGYIVHFTGEKSGDPLKIANDFKAKIGTKRVLFPLSSISNRSVSQIFPAKQRIETIIYKTVISQAQIPPCEFYVFTSPSNVDGFLLQNSFPATAKLIAWGETTASYLKNKSLEVFHTLTKSSLEELIELINNTQTPFFDNR